MDNQKLKEEFCKYSNYIEYIIKLLERYIYLDILKNPPKSESYYHTKYDLLNINNYPNCSDYYNFYGSIKKWLSQAEDAHLSLTLNSKKDPDRDYPYPEKKLIRESFAISPIKIHISKAGEVFAVPSKFINYFDDKIQKIVKDNKNSSIHSINNIDPISYIQTFNDNFNKMRSEQAQFVINQNIIELFDFDSYPFKKGHLQGINIIYSNNNNQSLTYDYLILRPKFNTSIFIDEFKRNIDNNSGTKNKIKWEQASSQGQLKCKVDKDNNMNVIYQNSFKFEKIGEEDNLIIASKILDKCFENFDKNNYPIIVIEDLNGGGLVSVANYLTEYLNLNKPNYLYSAMKNSFSIMYDYDDYSIKRYSDELRNYSNCKFEKGKKFFEDSHFINYGYDSQGETIYHEITDLFDTSIINFKKIHKFRKKAKNIRKPNEIIIFTDGYSFSATSQVIKGTQLRQGAIIVGYGGNPNLKIFDASQSPSAVKSSSLGGDIYEQRLERYGFTFSYTYEEIFKYYKDIKYPLEFEIMNIDERVELYNKYDDSRYQEFIDEAKKIFEKYNNVNCNPNNKNIILLSEKCKFSDNFTHGGFECGADGKWSDKCVPSFCDMGYYFDIIQKKCIVDPCYSVYEEEIKRENLESYKNIAIIVCIVLTVIIFLIVIFFCIKKKSNSFNKILDKTVQYLELQEFEY